MERDRAQKQHAAAARERAIDRLVDLLASGTGGGSSCSEAERVALREEIQNGKADTRKVFVKLRNLPNRTSPNRGNSVSHEEMLAPNWFSKPSEALF